MKKSKKAEFEDKIESVEKESKREVYVFDVQLLFFFFLLLLSRENS